MTAPGALAIEPTAAEPTAIEPTVAAAEPTAAEPGGCHCEPGCADACCRPPVVRDAAWHAAARKAKLLSWFSLGYMALEGTVAIIAAILASSVALLGFGLDSVIEGLASVIIVWRFSGSRMLSETAESRAQKAVAVTFFLLAPYIAYDAVTTLAAGDKPSTSWLGIALSISSLIIMPLLGRAKHRLGAVLDSGATSGEGTQNRRTGRPRRHRSLARRGMRLLTPRGGGVRVDLPPETMNSTGRPGSGEPSLVHPDDHAHAARQLRSSIRPCPGGWEVRAASPAPPKGRYRTNRRRRYASGPRTVSGCSKTAFHGPWQCARPSRATQMHTMHLSRRSGAAGDPAAGKPACLTTVSLHVRRRRRPRQMDLAGCVPLAIPSCEGVHARADRTWPRGGHSRRWKDDARLPAAAADRRRRAVSAGGHDRNRLRHDGCPDRGSCPTPHEPR
ncbi:hypothetical protein [Kitasatospora sp. HPMI-4]|uniref:hypothetical protein n=1 Tax=Kitasatospora sp. HPMI-4 TaxID=3448443 RepID=UPI003F1E328F